MYKGEIISLIVAMSWTATALFAEVASRRLGSLALNVVRMTMCLILLALTLWVTLGVPYPPMADGQTWFWLCLSGFVGYVFGDFCLFQSYILMNSRFGQLFMTLASPASAIAAWIMLGETMQPLAILGMIITMLGISMSILNKGHDGHKKLELKLPWKGVLCGIGAGVGQGVGLVLSKVGMEHYTSSIASHGISDLTTYVNEAALFPVSLDFMMPFASTLIRAVMGLIGFSIVVFFFSHKSREKLRTGIHDNRAMLCALGAAVFGPFIGVSLSLMATLYTHAGIAQTIMATTPVIIIAPSYFLFKQKVTPLEIVGAIISVIGVTLFFI